MKDKTKTMGHIITEVFGAVDDEKLDEIYHGNDKLREEIWDETMKKLDEYGLIFTEDDRKRASNIFDALMALSDDVAAKRDAVSEAETDLFYADNAMGELVGDIQEGKPVSVDDFLKMANPPGEWR